MKEKITTSLERKEKHDGSVRFISKRHCETKRGYSDNDVEFMINNDGSISLAADKCEHFIYLYPEQVKHLKKVLKVKP